MAPLDLKLLPRASDRLPRISATIHSALVLGHRMFLKFYTKSNLWSPIVRFHSPVAMLSLDRNHSSGHRFQPKFTELYFWRTVHHFGHFLTLLKPFNNHRLLYVRKTFYFHGCTWGYLWMFNIFPWKSETFAISCLKPRTLFFLTETVFFPRVQTRFFWPRARELNVFVCEETVFIV